MNRRWLVSRTNPEYIKYISKAASISPVLAQILINRGIKTQQEISDFLNPTTSGFSDPFEISGVKAAVERIQHAVKFKQRILIHGDYDADGLTATALLTEALKKAGNDAQYFIPNRIRHGYGFNIEFLSIAKEQGADLIITVDCGITSLDAASEARKLGIDVIITDHHEPIKNRIHDEKDHASFEVPEAIAVINPKLSAQDSRRVESQPTKFANLSGAGIAFKLAQALDIVSGTDYASGMIDLAALGTMADVVPLTGENRIIAREGIRLIKEGRRKGIHALKGIARLENKELRAELLAYTIIPRINAAGRIADAGDVIRLLLTEESEEAFKLSSWLDQLNSERQKIEEDVYQQAIAQINQRVESTETGVNNVLVLSGEGWHQGVVGIVASRLAEEFSRPAIVLSITDGIAKGSGRSIPAFDLCTGLAAASSALISFGGHKQAAGIKLRAENISDFEKQMQEVISSTLTEADLITLLEIDADISLQEVNHNLISELRMLEPLGCGNSEPVLGARGLKPVNPRIVGNNHLKMRLKQGSQSIDAIGFDMGGSLGLVVRTQADSLIDAVFTPVINEWSPQATLLGESPEALHGEEKCRCIQLNLKALRLSNQ